MTYSITIKNNETESEVTRNFHEAVFEGDYLLEQLNSMKETIDGNKINF